MFNSELKAEVRALRVKVDALSAQVADLTAKQVATSAATLRAQIDELEAALESLQRSNRRELGRLWKLFSREQEEAHAAAESPEEVRARLRAEHGLPKIGGRANGASKE